jgi:hypothetical protein
VGRLQRHGVPLQANPLAAGSQAAAAMDASRCSVYRQQPCTNLSHIQHLLTGLSSIRPTLLFTYYPRPRFVCRRKLGDRRGERGAAYLTPVPPGAVVYGTGDAARVISKVRMYVCGGGGGGG